MDTIVVGYDLGFKMCWPRAYTPRAGPSRTRRAVHTLNTTDLPDIVRLNHAQLAGQQPLSHRSGARQTSHVVGTFFAGAKVAGVGD
ncbi:MAG TPA: hypothetical protein VJR89_40155, partial [Polyangiales bacterium]|nr:hypothetical protein [Polyangiales bacterium]